MDKSQIEEVVNEAARVYNKAPGGMSGLDSWVRGYDREHPDFPVVQRLYEEVISLNTDSSTRVFSMDPYLVRGLVDRLMNVCNSHQLG